MADEVSESASGNVLTSEQMLALADEARAVVQLSRRGIEEIWRIDAANDFVHLPLQLLAQGFERLLKLTYALALLRDGSLPEPGTFRGRGAYGHDILRLTDDLLSVVADRSEYADRPAVKDDLAFIRSNSDLRRILHLLSTFGTWSRYYRFDEFLDPTSVDPADDPDAEWQKIETDVIRGEADGMQLLSDPSRSSEVHRRISEHVTGLLERFARAITRMWTLGALHKEASRHLGVINDFLFLRDEDLGSSRLPRRARQARGRS